MKFRLPLKSLSTNFSAIIHITHPKSKTTYTYRREKRHGWLSYVLVFNYIIGDEIVNLDKNKIYEPDIPMGLDFALTQNRAARDCFYSLPEAMQVLIMERTHTIGSKEEMKDYVDSLVGHGETTYTSLSK